MGNIASSNVGNPKVERPPVGKGRLIGEAVAAVAGMGVVVVPGSVIIPRFFTGDDSLAVFIIWIFFCCPFLMPLAAATTVYLIGKIGEQTGFFGTTLVHSVVGMILGAIAGMIIISFGPLVHAPFLIRVVLYVLLFVCIALGSSLGAVRGFNLTRRYKEAFAAKNVAQKDSFQLVKEFESKTSESQSARSEQAERQ